MDDNFITIDEPEQAAFLESRGIPILETLPHGRFLKFAFPAEHSFKIRQLILEYAAGGTVPAKVFADHLRVLKRKIAAHRQGAGATK